MPVSAFCAANAAATGNAVRYGVAADGIQTFDTVRCRALCLVWAILAMLRNFRVNLRSAAPHLTAVVLATAFSRKSGDPMRARRNGAP